MMGHPSLSVIALVLALSGNVFAQQRLVRHNDRDDPCRRFKMRILIPADVVDRELPAKGFAGGLDSKMVWNPCPTSVPQIAFSPFISPARNDTLFPKPPFSFQSGLAERPRKPEELLLAAPRFTFPRTWRRP
jgi:hypothetical protein